MHSRLYKLAAALSIALAAGGCVQATRHSNTMVFGTNTSIGVKIGASAASIPEVQLGYARQEAVIMPLVANTRSETGSYGDDLLQPCDLTGSVEVTGGGQFAVHPCSLVAINGKALDTYSVLASFGAKIKGSASAQNGEAGIGLAQYFATGMAAQMLALNGGASVVAVSQAAEESAKNRPDAETVENLFGDTNAFQLGVQNAKTYADFRSALVGKVDSAADDDSVKIKIANFEINAGINTRMRTICAKKADCLNAIRGDAYGQRYNMNAKAMSDAIVKW